MRERQKYYLNIGEVVVAHQPMEVKTVLGSCVAVSLYNPKTGVSAICHAQLPERFGSQGKCYHSCTNPCFRELADDKLLKYVTCSIDYMRQKLGFSKNLLGSIVGGSSMLAATAAINIARRNVDMAELMLQKYGIAVVHRDTGGSRGRTLVYFSDLNRYEIKLHAA